MRAVLSGVENLEVVNIWRAKWRTRACRINESQRKWIRLAFLKRWVSNFVLLQGQVSPLPTLDGPGKYVSFFGSIHTTRTFLSKSCQLSFLQGYTDNGESSPSEVQMGVRCLRGTLPYFPDIDVKY